LSREGPILSGGCYDSTGTLYPSFDLYSGGSGITADDIIIPSALFLPVPLISDGYGSAFGTSDGAGHLELSGLGSGGGGKTWGAVSGSFSVSSGKAVGDTTGGGGIALDTVSLSTPDIMLSCDLTRADASVGIVLRYVDASNYLVARHDGTSAQLVKRAAGTESNLITAAATYSAGATIRVVADGSSLTLYYNSVKIGATTVETQGVTSKIVGVRNVGSTANKHDNFVSYARGTANEYGILDNFK
jgi:hypothetical protein